MVSVSLATVGEAERTRRHCVFVTPVGRCQRSPREVDRAHGQRSTSLDHLLLWLSLRARQMRQTAQCPEYRRPLIEDFAHRSRCASLARGCLPCEYVHGGSMRVSTEVATRRRFGPIRRRGCLTAPQETHRSPTALPPATPGLSPAHPHPKWRCQARLTEPRASLGGAHQRFSTNHRSSSDHRDRPGGSTSTSAPSRAGYGVASRWVPSWTQGVEPTPPSRSDAPHF